MSDYIANPSRIPWPPVLLVGLGAMAGILTVLVPLPWPGVNDTAARVIGYGFLGSGVALIAWSLITFARARTNIRPDRAATTLVTTGPFAIWRNPIYMGDALVLLGLAQPTHSLWFVAVAALFVVLVLKLAIMPEEAHLEAKFGEAYLAYQARSRRWF